MTAGALGRLASRENLLSEAPRFGWSREEADRVIDEIKHIVSDRWRSVVEAQGGTARDCEAVAGAFAYDGFEQPAPG